MDVKTCIQQKTRILVSDQRLTDGSVELKDSDNLEGVAQRSPCYGAASMFLLRRNPVVAEWMASQVYCRSGNSRRNHCELEDAPVDVRSDREGILLAAKWRGADHVFTYADNAVYRDDREIALSLLWSLRGPRGEQILQNLAPCILADPEVIAEAVKRDVAMDDEPAWYRREIEVQKGHILKLAAESLQRDRSFVLSVIQLDVHELKSLRPEFLNDREVVLVAIRENAQVAKKHIPERYWEDNEVRLAAFLGSNRNLDAVPDEWFLDRDFIVGCVCQRRLDVLCKTPLEFSLDHDLRKLAGCDTLVDLALAIHECPFPHQLPHEVQSRLFPKRKSRSSEEPATKHSTELVEESSKEDIGITRFRCQQRQLRRQLGLVKKAERLRMERRYRSSLRGGRHKVGEGRLLAA